MPETAKPGDLEGQRRQLLATVVRRKRAAPAGSNVEPEAEDEAQEETTTQLLVRLDERERAAIAAVDDALARIAAGTYGSCEQCGGAIAAARLTALPEATTCMRCAKRDGGPRAPAAS
jgi:RNA polymerase-binding protein DksA